VGAFSRQDVGWKIDRSNAVFEGMFG